jgi:acetate kinase
MADAIAVLNAGSSTLKFSLFTRRDETFELIALPTNEELMIARHTWRLLHPT